MVSGRIITPVKSLPICGKILEVMFNMLCDTVTTDASYLYDKRCDHSVAYLKRPETRQMRNRC